MEAKLKKFLQPFQHLRIQLEEIQKATNNFSDNHIGVGGFGNVYKGEVSHSKGRSMVAIKRLDPKRGQGIPEFLKEITTLSDYSHQNLISLLGFCCEGSEFILVYEHASLGSLDRHLNSPHLTWLQRVKICLDVAKGLRYLHDPRKTHRRLIHCDVKSANILLDDQWNAKVSDFGLSIIGSANEEHSVIVTMAAGTPGYCDPEYEMTHTLTKESDVYSFGVVLVEVLCGTLCCTYSNGHVQQNLVPTWIESYKEKKLKDIIFKNPTIPLISLEIFSDIAHRCLNESREDRPTMAEVVTELTTALRHQELFQRLKIPLEEITSATNHFDDEKNYIGGGAFGKVYKGQVSHSKGRSVAAVKRLDPKHGQGIPEFLKDIVRLSSYAHENLVSLLGFCLEGHEMILVYEHASRGSLDHHLNSPHLTWSQRLKICLDAAKGLSYLHDPRETHQRLIHCDIKSANILLDDHWNAKVSDFGLSIMGSANEQQSTIITLAAGTWGYIDPQYAMTHTLTKESDVYSFGVVLFEVLCGALCCTYSNGRVQHNFLPTWIESYREKKLNDIIFKSPTIGPLDQISLSIFSNIAYRCLMESREDRPKMAEIVTKIETALKNQELFESREFKDEWNKQHSYYEEIIRSAEPPLNYRSEVELKKLLCKGVLLNCGKTWFSLNKKGEHCEMISIAECLGSKFESDKRKSRFATGTRIYYSCDGIMKADVRTQFLSPGITYMVNLVFKVVFLGVGKCKPIGLKYKLQGETESSISYLAYQREDGWWMCELYQFTTDHKIVHLQILFEGCYRSSIDVEGVEFQPLEKVKHRDEKQPISDSAANWEEKMPTDYQDIIKRSKNSVHWTTKKAAYSFMRKGFLMKEDIWFSLDKNGKKCHMISSTKACKIGLNDRLKKLSRESRFEEAIEFGSEYIYIKSKVRSQLVSSETTYAVYLVYKLPEDESRFRLLKRQSRFEAPVRVRYQQLIEWFFYLVSPQIPVISPKADQNTHNPLNRPTFKGLPQQRNDDWMEVQIWEFRTTREVHMNLSMSSVDKKKFSGLIIEGIEFRPI